MVLELANAFYKLRLSADRNHEYGQAYAYSEAENLLYKLPPEPDANSLATMHEALVTLRAQAYNAKEDQAWEKIFTIYAKCFAL